MSTPSLDRQRAAGQAAARAARDPRHPRLVAGAHHRGDLGAVGGQDRGARHDAVLQQAVGLVGAQLVAVGEDVRLAADRAQALDQVLGRTFVHGPHHITRRETG